MCGSGSYDRDDYYSRSSSSYDSSSGFDYSSAARQALTPPTPVRATSTSASASQAKPPAPVKPRSTVSASPLQRVKCKTKNGVVVVLDGTCSTADAVYLFWDKLPLLYSQLVDQKYLKDFSISFASVGDVTCDPHPFQITDFLKGKKLDEALKALELDRGGGQIELCESYEYAAYSYANLTTLASDMERKPFLFLHADEAPRATLSGAQLTKVFGGAHEDISTEAVFEQLRAKYEVYVLCTPYRGGGFAEQDMGVRREWEKHLPDRVVNVKEPKSIVDLILGIVAVQTGSRTVEKYLSDMKSRNQSDERLSNVEEALKALFSN